MGSSPRLLLLPSAIFAALSLSACQSEEAPESPAAERAELTQSVESEQPPVESAIVAEPTEQTAFNLTTADIDAFVKGLKAENEFARDAAEKKKAAETDEQRLAIMMDAVPQALKAQAVEASGLDRQRYFKVRDSVSQILSAVDMKSIMVDQAEPVSTEGMSDEQAKVVQDNMDLVRKTYGDPFKDVSPEVAEVIQQRLDELKQLQKENMTLIMAVAQG